MDPAAIAPYLVGPGAAVVVLLVVLYGIWRTTTVTLAPAMMKALDRHLSAQDALVAELRSLVKSHDMDRAAWVDGLRAQDRQLEIITESVTRCPNYPAANVRIVE